LLKKLAKYWVVFCETSIDYHFDSLPLLEFSFIQSGSGCTLNLNQISFLDNIPPRDLLLIWPLRTILKKWFVHSFLVEFYNRRELVYKIVPNQTGYPTSC
jgi:hypothetical protein